MKTISKERLEKVAIWAGFRKATQEEYSPGSTPDSRYDRRGWGYRYPDGSIKWFLPDFPHNESACFKWLVPKLDEWSISKTERNEGEFLPRAVIGHRDAKNNWHYSSKWAETPSLALYLAIEKLIDEEEK